MLSFASHQRNRLTRLGCTALRTKQSNSGVALRVDAIFHSTIF